ELANQPLGGTLSPDPFLRKRQSAAAELRNIWVRFSLISALDQQKTVLIRNPYAVYLEMASAGDELTLVVDGIAVQTTRANFKEAIHSTRRNLYSGGAFESFDTMAPWMQSHIAQGFRFIKQRLDAHRELTPMD